MSDSREEGVDASSVRWKRILFALCIADVAGAFETIMILAALKSILVEFGDPSVVGWMIISYLIISALAAAIGSRLADMIDGRWVLIAALAIAVAGSVLSLASDDLLLIYIGRGLQGAAGAVMPISMGLVRKYCPAARVSLGLGFLLAASGVAATAGGVLGAMIVDRFAWHYIFAASGLACLVALVLCWALLPARPRPKTRAPLDIVGALLFIPAIVGVLLGIDLFSKGNVGLATGLALGGSALLAVWARHEYHHAHPLIDVRLLMRREMAMPNICGLFWSAGAMQSMTLQMLYLQQPVWTGVGLGLTATMAALLKIPTSFMTTLAAPVAGHATSLFGSRSVVIGGFALAVAGWAAMLTMPDDFVVFILISSIGCAVPIAVIYAGLSSAVVMSAPADRASEAAGVFAVSRTVGAAIGVQVVMAALAAWPAPAMGQGDAVFPSTLSYQAAFFYIIVMCVIGMLVAVALPRRRAGGGQEAMRPSPALP